MENNRAMRRKDTTKGPPLRILSLGKDTHLVYHLNRVLTEYRWRWRTGLLDAHYHPRAHAPNIC